MYSWTSLCSRRIRCRGLALLAAAALAACGGGGSGSSGGSSGGSGSGGGGSGGGTTTYTIGGTLSGLASGESVVLLDNGGDALTVSANGAFTFKTAIAAGGAYAVTVGTQPGGQTCSVAAGSGTASANVTSVTVTCATNAPTAYTLGGGISGLTAAGLQLSVLAAGATQTLPVSAGATSFVFPNGYTLPASGTSYTEYNVSIAAQPAGETCLATSAHGYVHSAADITSVQISCFSNTTDPLQGLYQVSSSADTNKERWIALYPDGTYIFAVVSNDSNCPPNNGNGVEYGVYNFNKSTGVFQFVNAVLDGNASCGLFNNGVSSLPALQASIAGSGSSTVITLTGSGTPTFTATAVPSVATSIVGAFGAGNSREQSVGAFGTDGHYLILSTQADAYSNTLAGLEYGCYTDSSGTVSWDANPSTCTVAVDTNGTAGLADGVTVSGSFAYTVVDANTIQIGSGAAAQTLTRFQPN